MNEIFKAKRMSRVPYLIAFLAVLVASIMGKVILLMAAGVDPILMRGFASIITLAATVLHCIFLAKRLHDMDLSGWYMVVPLVFIISGAIIILRAFNDSGLIVGEVIAWAGFLAYFVPFFWPGTKGPNRFGPAQKLSLTYGVIFE